MNAGLQGILNRIAKDPSNRMLINRYVTLVRELAVDAEKARSTLDLAKALRKHDPNSAMEYGFMVFQFDRLCIEALELVANCLRDMGRLGKAEVIEQEVIKLRKLRQSSSVDSRGQDSKRTFVMEASKVSVDGVSVDVFQADHSVMSKPIENIKTVKLPPIPETINSFPDVLEKPRNISNVVEKKTIAIPEILSSELLHQNADNELGRVSSYEELVIDEEKEIGLNHSNSFDGVEGVSWNGPDLGVLLELFDFYYRQGLMSDAKDLLESCKKIASHMPWWQARSSMLERCGMAVSTLMPGSQIGRTSSIGSKKHKSHERSSTNQAQLLPVTTSAILVDLEKLRLAGKARVALQKIREHASVELPIETASALYRELAELIKELNLRPFDWKPSMGVSDFVVKINQRLRPTASFSII